MGFRVTEFSFKRIQRGFKGDVKGFGGLGA